MSNYRMKHPFYTYGCIKEVVRNSLVAEALSIMLKEVEKVRSCSFNRCAYSLLSICINKPFCLNNKV